MDYGHLGEDGERLIHKTLKVLDFKRGAEGKLKV